MSKKEIKNKLLAKKIDKCAPQQIYVDYKLRELVNVERKKLKTTWSKLLEAMFTDFLDKR